MSIVHKHNIEAPYEKTLFAFSKPAIFSVTLFLFSPLHGQSVVSSHDSCDVIVPQGYEESRSANARRVPSQFAVPSTESVINNTGKVYTFRLATCILPEYVQTGFGNPYSPKSKAEVIAEVHKWWDQLEKDLNSVYNDAVGVKFEIVRNDNLILFGLTDHGLNLDA